MLVVFAALCIGALFFTVPHTHDDYWYLRNINDYGTDTDCSFSFVRGVIGTVIDHHFHDNSRFANVFGTLIVSMPLWLSALLSAVSVLATLLLMVKLSEQKSSFVAVTSIVMMYTFFMPWNDMLFSLCFTYSYVWAGALMLVAIWLFMRDKKTWWGWMFAYGLFFGGWHEIYSFPVLAGGVLCFMFHRKMLRADRVWLCAGLLIGCIWLWMSPSRTSDTGYGSLINFHRPWRDMIGAYWLPFIFIIIESIYICIRKVRKYALSPVALFAVSCFTICLPVYIFSGALRAITPAIIMSCIGIVFLLGKVVSCENLLMKGVFAALWVFFALHIGASFVTGVKVYNEEMNIIAEYEKAKEKDGVVFADYTTPSSAPWITFGKPVQWLYGYYSHSSLVGKYYHSPRLKVIPKALENFDSSRAKKIEGNIDLWEFEGSIVARNIKVEPTVPVVEGEFRYVDGKTLHGALAYPFLITDTCEYVFLNAPARGLIHAEIYERN